MDLGPVQPADDPERVAHSQALDSFRADRRRGGGGQGHDDRVGSPRGDGGSDAQVVSGIGRELAARFAEDGYDLVVAAEDERIESAARALGRASDHGRSRPRRPGHLRGVEELERAIQATGRRPEAVAINAGVSGDFARDNELADELRLIGLNVTGAVHLAKRVLAEMISPC